jgi:hypothetical protein
MRARLQGGAPVSVNGDRDRRPHQVFDPGPRAGIGLRTEHEALIAPNNLTEYHPISPQVSGQNIPWVEIHSENYLGAGGARLAALREIRSEIPVSCHCVGISPGSAEGPDPDHLDRLANLFDWLEPAVISDHLSWSVSGGVYLNDLLPLPYSEEALQCVTANVEAIQDRFGRRILIENPSSYLTLPNSVIPEWEFLNELCRRTGCGILLDLNNIIVSAANTGLDQTAYLRNIDKEAIGEFHLAGHAHARVKGQAILIDDHGSVVPQNVWALYEDALRRIGPRPTLIEWDTNLPDLAVLLAEAAKADRFLGVLNHAA